MSQTIEHLPFELQSLSKAVRYQHWSMDAVSPFMGKRILELGSGIGNMSQHLPAGELLYLTEASSDCFTHLKKMIEQRAQNAEPVEGELLDLNQPWVDRLSQKNFDTVVSFNVMEHIEDDEAAFRQQYQILKASQSSGVKRIVVFVPAHPWLFGSLDRIFLHFRRYRRDRIQKLFQKIDPQCKVQTRHFNLVGTPGWFMMGRVLKKTTIDMGAIKTFERLIPWIRALDDFIHVVLKFPVGQSLITVITLPSN